MLHRITPARVWVALITVFLAAIAERTGSMLGFWRHGLNPNTPFSVLMVAAYGVALPLCWKIAQDHKGSAAMRASWLLLAGSAALSIVRHLQQAMTASGLFPGFERSASYVPTQVPMALALVMLFAGLVAMWRAFSALRLGFRPRGTDYAVIVLMLSMLPPILAQHSDRLPPGTPAWATVLPFMGAVFLPACGAVAVLLHRIADQMQGGQAARFLTYLIWFPGIRLVAMLASVDPTLRAIPPLSVVAYAMYQVVPLVFTLAVAYRWQITVRADQALEADSADAQHALPASIG